MMLAADFFHGCQSGLWRLGTPKGDVTRFLANAADREDWLSFSTALHGILRGHWLRGLRQRLGYQPLQSRCEGTPTRAIRQRQRLSLKRTT